jgi:type IV secretory pathway VirB4 component
MTPQKPSAIPESSGRKPWIKKTPVEIFLEQIAKQEQRVAELHEVLAHEERELEKLQEARTVLERK